MYQCPQCQKRLINFWHNKLPVLFCNICNAKGVLFHNAAFFFKDHKFNQSLIVLAKESKIQSTIKCFCCNTNYKKIELDSHEKFSICPKCNTFWFTKDDLSSMPFNTNLDHHSNYKSSAIYVTTSNRHYFTQVILQPFTVEVNAEIASNEFPFISTILSFLFILVFRTKLNLIFAFKYLDGINLKMILTALTSALTHGNLTHLLFNLFVFISFAPVLENYVGSINFLILFFASNFISLMFSTLLHSSIGLAGASVSISAMIGAYIYFFPNAKILIFNPFKSSSSQFLHDNFTGVIWGYITKIPVFFFFIINILKDALALNQPDGIYHAGHIFGFFFGYFWAMLLSSKKIRSK